MKLVHLYRVRFRYPQGWQVALGPPDHPEAQCFYLAEGTCEGRLQGVFHGANHPRRRGNRTFEPDFQGIIETADGATIFFEYRGYGRAYPIGRRQIVASATHLSDHAKYLWLNDALAVGVGEVRTKGEENAELVIDWSEVVWEQIPE